MEIWGKDKKNNKKKKKMVVCLSSPTLSKVLSLIRSQLAERKLQDDDGQQCMEINWTFLAFI